MSGDTILAVDIGGTKMLAALVTGAEVDDERDVATPREDTAEGWCDALAALVADWAGRYRAVAAAVTGQVKDGRWYTLNPAILPIPSGFPLAAALAYAAGQGRDACQRRASRRLGRAPLRRRREARTSSFSPSPPASAAASFPAGGCSPVIMASRRASARRRSPSTAGVRIEDVAGGGAMAARERVLPVMHCRRAWRLRGERGRRRMGRADHRPLGRDDRPPHRSTFRSCSTRPSSWSAAASGSRPDFSTGCAAGLRTFPSRFTPTIRAAGLGKHAGVIGVADLARRTFTAKGD